MAWRGSILRIYAVCLIVGLVGLLPAAHAAEEILSYDVAIIVKRDGSLDVTETIRVRAEGRQIRRGIYRDFPVRYRNKDGSRRTVSFDIVEVKRDGRSEPYFTEGGSQLRTYIGDADVFLNHGEYTYTLRYKTSRQLRFFKDYDELYWNVTGTNWVFPIRAATVRIELPNNTVIENYSGYTGRYGSKRQDYRATGQGPGFISFETTRPLGPFEGLSVAISWRKGIIAEPTSYALWWRFLLDNIGLLLLSAGTIAVAGYFFGTWWRIGRDPPSGTIIPLFKPPEGLSPAAMSYLHFMGFKNSNSSASKSFVAVLVSLAVKGLMAIDETGKKMAVEKIGKEPASLPPGEKAVWDKLFANKDRLSFNKTNGSRISSAQVVMKSALLKEHGNVFFKKNIAYFVIGAVATAVIVIVSMIFLAPSDNEISMFIPPLVGSILGSLGLSMGLRRLLGWYPGGGSKLLGVIFTLLGLVPLAGVSFLISEFSRSASPIIPTAAVALGVMSVAFFHLLRAPTVVGRKLMDDVDGYRLYLETAEADRMNLIGAPDFTQAHFEENLPYAIALGVEKPWSQAFSEHLARVMPAGGTGAYHPIWYHGDNFRVDNLSSSTQGLVSSIGSGVAASVPRSSGSSSGSSGGGSSGGGGGGGGGGGW